MLHKIISIIVLLSSLFINYSCNKSCSVIVINKRCEILSYDIVDLKVQDNITNLRFSNNHQCTFILNNTLCRYDLEKSKLSSIIDSNFILKIDFIGIANRKLNKKQFLSAIDLANQKDVLTDMQFNMLFNNNKLINYWVDGPDVFLFFKINTLYIEYDALIAGSTNFITKTHSDSIIYTIPLIDKYNNIKNDGLLIDKNHIYLSNSIILYKDSIIDNNYNPAVGSCINIYNQIFTNIDIYYPLQERLNATKFFNLNATFPYYKYLHTINFCKFGGGVLATDYKSLLSTNGDSVFTNMTKVNEIIATIPFEISSSDSYFLFIKSVIDYSTGDIKQLLTCFNTCKNNIDWVQDLTEIDKISNHAIYKNSYN